jgi:hypothetical protein
MLPGVMPGRLSGSSWFPALIRRTVGVLAIAIAAQFLECGLS